MEQADSNAPTGTYKSLSVKSWTAYLFPIVIMFALVTMFVPLMWHYSQFTSFIIMLGAITYIAYTILLVRSYCLYYDDDGVWVHSGILPWKKGITGVKWRDLDEAVYFQSMGSWIFKSYSIRIGHRFTKSSEIFLTHIVNGHKSVMEINQIHQAKIRVNEVN